MMQCSAHCTFEVAMHVPVELCNVAHQPNACDSKSLIFICFERHQVCWLSGRCRQRCLKHCTAVSSVAPMSVCGFHRMLGSTSTMPGVGCATVGTASCGCSVGDTPDQYLHSPSLTAVHATLTGTHKPSLTGAPPHVGACLVQLMY